VINYYKIAINFHFEGGSGVDAYFTDGFSVSIEHPTTNTKPDFTTPPTHATGAAPGPKHSAFCGACFSINPYSVISGPKSQKSRQKNHEPSTFFKPVFEQNLTQNYRFFNLSLPRFFNLIFFSRRAFILSPPNLFKILY
jgi:hypothetical protein